MKENHKDTGGNLIHSLSAALAVFLLMVSIAFFILMGRYDTYIDDILYQSRQQQKK